MNCFTQKLHNLGLLTRLWSPGTTGELCTTKLNLPQVQDLLYASYHFDEPMTLGLGLCGETGTGQHHILSLFSFVSLPW